MKLAAIDIGSNAIRLHIVKVFEENNLVSFKKLEYLRFPLRLGHDVFKKKMISIPTLDKFTKLMRTFKLLIDLYEVEGYSAVATSAMREAENGEEVRDYILNQTGVKIDIISGEDEARVLYKAILPYLQSSHSIHIDVGGGSTELNFFESKNLLKSKSFKIGSVRKLSREQRIHIFQEMKEWAQIAKESKPKNIVGIGTGGNIGKLFKLSKKPVNQAMSLVELKGLAAYVKEFSVEQRMSMLKMNPDRADVIIPASEIYIKVLQNVGSDSILVPKVGLKDGLVYELYEQMTGKSIDQIEFLEDF
ncbi:MAG: exopolyphosphatase/guanosine-5'-triphosphate,3'-diphosphate pyrophosphatase [Paraglaciecola sp.]|jgi:exopolyphosphatase/guanosine-5'-triphosphate,3'-diphosphate pyrophosphatase